MSYYDSCLGVHYKHVFPVVQITATEILLGWKLSPHGSGGQSQS